MRKAIIACLAFAFLTSPLHAESAGSAALKGAAKGAGEGGGGTHYVDPGIIGRGAKGRQ